MLHRLFLILITVLAIIFRWMEACLKEELPPTTELEEAFRNGVFLAKLGNFFSPETVPLRKIFDKEFKVVNVSAVSCICCIIFPRFVGVSFSFVAMCG